MSRHVLPIASSERTLKVMPQLPFARLVYWTVVIGACIATGWVAVGGAPNLFAAVLSLLTVWVLVWIVYEITH